MSTESAATDLASGDESPSAAREMPSIAGATPMLRQYLEIKAGVPDALLFFRLGDFYELFYDDARVASEILGITLTARPKGEDRIPMCGVPHHAAKGHIARLVEAGHRVAICDQAEAPGPGKTIVRREVTRIVTPGTVFDEDNASGKTLNYLACLVPASKAGGALALLEATTGDFRVFCAETDAQLLEELARVEPRELLVGDARGDARFEPLPVAVTQTRRDKAAFDAKRAAKTLCAHFGVGSLDGFGLGREPEGAVAAAVVLHYVEETQRSALRHVRQLVRYEPSASLIIDSASRRNLDLVRNSVDGHRAGSLLGTIDKTSTSMGGRMLAKWLLYPLTDIDAIRQRQEAVAELLTSAVLREDLTTVLLGIGDLERLLSRLVVGQGTARDVRLLGASLAQLPAFRNILGDVRSQLLGETARRMPETDDLAVRLLAAIVDEPPATIREGGMFRRGFDAELDELLELAASGKDSIARMEAAERQRTGIQSLKIRFNRVFGYYIEVTRANLDSVPADYVRRQTTANAERFVTPWLQEYEGKVLTAEERSIALEQKLFEELRQQVIARAAELLDIALLLARTDVLLSFARTAADHNYNRPDVNEGALVRIHEGRHPVVERALGREPFVPNDIELDTERRLLVLTGPNMAGKSTAMRQVALITVLAQMGSYVPARSAVIGVCDRLFTRVGAGDDLARGQSTFMLEMSETANILRHATARSLVLLDEIGRGTSTFDGLAIAWAVAEHIHDHLRCRTLFATHYHELTALAAERPHVVNMTMSVREWQGKVVFLRKLVPGAASRSYGVQVAKLAGVPAPVLARAYEVLAQLEQAGSDADGHQPVFATAGRKHTQAQLSLGLGRAASGTMPAAAASPVLQELTALDVNAITPMQALEILHRWKAGHT